MKLCWSSNPLPFLLYFNQTDCDIAGELAVPEVRTRGLTLNSSIQNCPDWSGDTDQCQWWIFVVRSLQSTWWPESGGWGECGHQEFHLILSKPRRSFRRVSKLDSRASGKVWRKQYSKSFNVTFLWRECFPTLKYLVPTLDTLQTQQIFWVEQDIQLDNWNDLQGDQFASWHCPHLTNYI